jgi:hypothetical protein
MSESAITKALEIWTLQNLLNLSITLAILATGLALIQGYYDALEKRLSLRVSIELWRIFTVLLVDLLLALAVLIGYLTLNPDIMSDVKMAVPFFPAATVLLAVALVLRLFHGGHELASKNYLRSLYLMLAACLVNVLGFTFVMEGASEEYLGTHPIDEKFWWFLRTRLRSNTNPEGIMFSQKVFYVCFPILLAVLAWGVWSGVGKLVPPQGKLSKEKKKPWPSAGSNGTIEEIEEPIQTEGTSDGR